MGETGSTYPPPNGLFLVIYFISKTMVYAVIRLVAKHSLNRSTGETLKQKFSTALPWKIIETLGARPAARH